MAFFTCICCWAALCTAEKFAKSLNLVKSYGSFSEIQDGACYHLVLQIQRFAMFYILGCHFDQHIKFYFKNTSIHCVVTEKTLTKSEMAATAILNFGRLPLWPRIPFARHFVFFLQNLSVICQS